MGTWPWAQRDPWPDAVLDAAHLALAHFTNLGNKKAVKRLPRAQVEFIPVLNLPPAQGLTPLCPYRRDE